MPADADDTLAALDALIGRLRAAGPVALAKSAAAFQAAGMARSPVRRGTLRRSWRVEVEGDVAEVGPTVIYSRRVELGFLPPNTDSLGRQFPHAYPHPYVRPAFGLTAPKIPAIAAGVLRAAIGG